ncbi:beta-ketoacyl reductase [Candidatus Mycobacterium methanotrophicum]|uniref:Beta-ketoacyl reductase n=1 Tax=Candidatus Mycobacterium methanotrophicum TaxID=2943498 RepID=A0ABY4QQH3_9MYCO|nr:beta-ketoacyl reductase [Candidatus Mycobacterium methanotrophicum]UQX13139.1 beta-ketoacyl reductase [Candidatus Mycobacterium methanotrophicum]
MAVVARRGERRRAGAPPPIRGVIHAAGITDAQLPTEISDSRLRRTMWPKIAGAQVLHEAFPPGMSVRRSTEQFVGIELSATMLFNHPTVASLAGYLAKKPLPREGPQDDVDMLSDSTSSVLNELFDSVESAPAGSERGI